MFVLGASTDVKPPLFPNHPVGLTEERSRLSPRFQRGEGDYPQRIFDYYQSALPEELQIPDAAGPAALDDVARRYLSARFQNICAHGPKYYGYFQGVDARGEPSNAYLRVVGFVPDAPVHGVMLDMRGYSHYLDHDLMRVENLVKAGIAVFNYERMNHGLSSRVDSSLPFLDSTEMLIRQAHQFLGVMKDIVACDPQLQGKRVSALASSLSFAELIGAWRMFEKPEEPFIERIVADNSMIDLSWGKKVILMMLEGISHFYDVHKKMRTPQRNGMSQEEHAALVERHKAFSFRHHPYYMRDLRRLIAANRKWLFSERAKITLPPLLMLVTTKDDTVKSESSYDIFRSLGRSSDQLRPTYAHSSFIGSRDIDPDLMIDVIDYCFRRRISGSRPIPSIA